MSAGPARPAQSPAAPPPPRRARRAGRFPLALPLALALALALSASPSWSLTARVKGTVQNEQGAPVEGVSLALTGSRILGKPLSASSNKKGQYSFILEMGSYQMRVEKEGYIPQVIDIGIRDEGMKVIDITLQSAGLAPAAADESAAVLEQEKPVGSLTGEAQKELKSGIEAFDGSDLERAEAIFRGLAASLPDKAEPHFYLGSTLAARKSWAEAESAFRRAVEIQPEMEQGWFGLAKAEVELGKHEEAESAIRRAAELNPEQAGRYYKTAANLYIARGDYPHIVSCLEKYNALHPGEADILFKMGSAYFNQGEMEKAISSFQAAAAADPAMIEAHYQLGMTYLNQGRNEDAARTFRTILEQAPDHSLAASAREILATIQ